jgi:Tfp pilus assembly protein PilV
MRKGVTFVEVLVSSLILVISITAFMHLIKYQNERFQFTHYNSYSVSLIKDYLERTQVQAKGSYLNSSDVDFKDGASVTTTFEGKVYTISFDHNDVELADTKLVEITVSASFDYGGETITNSISTRTRGY